MAEVVAGSTGHRVPVASWTQPHSQLWLLDPLFFGVPACSRRLTQTSGGKYVRTGQGRSCKAGWSVHTPFPQTSDALLDTSTRLLFSRKRPVQSLSWQIETSTTLAALQDEPAASMAQQGLPRSLKPGQAPITRPHHCSCRAPGPASLALLLSCPTLWPKHHPMPIPTLSPIPQLTTLIVPGVRWGIRRPGCKPQDHTGCVDLGKSLDLCEPQFPHQ